jgi:hypothetical protein
MSVSSFKKSPLLTVNSMGVSHLRKRKNSITLSSRHSAAENSLMRRKGLKNGLETRIGPAEASEIFLCAASGQ